MQSHAQDLLCVGLAQIAPIWLNRQATLDKAAAYVEAAATKGCRLLVFGEALVPGYPFWVELTDGARFNDPLQKSIYAEYAEQAVVPELGHLNPLCALAKQHQIAIYLGCIERAADRSGHSLYCSLIYIDASGEIASVHRKLMPTHEERLVWAIGDGHGLRTHPLGPFRVGGLNCWENWMPLSRTALYAQGEDLHVAVWPGSVRNTEDITRFIALESRSYVISVSGLLRRQDIGTNSVWRDLLTSKAEPLLANGGSCIAGPDGQWVIPPHPEEETLLVATLDHRQVRQERQAFDPTGHYSRPDITKLSVNRQRQNLVQFKDETL